ncbi:hypothetical protein QOZ80_1AG0016130 [Eleusine coracana subsp. coracana]|nr:hypothetical protein QOZ80_1AG0016130 [Eleusine coracana subsp. coracana]
MNRYRAFAEGVVVMVCPVLLAIALDKVNLKNEEHGSVIPIIMLVIAAITLVTGIFPCLICHLSSGSPHIVTKCLAPLSSMCLVALACWIIRLIMLHNWSFPAFGFVFGLCIVIRTAMYCRGCAEAENTAEPQPQPAALIAAKEYCITLENSVDFLAGITALLFVGLEGLALEGQISRDRPTQDHLTKPMGASFFACVFGILFMVLETAPPLITDHEVVKLTKLFDVLMTCAISLVIFFITDALSKIPALLVFAPTFLILMVLAFHHTFTNNAPAPPPLPTVTNNPPTPASSPAVTNNDTNGESNKPASLELMKVIFTGFLAVSITSISKDSHNKGTHWFILLAAAAIVSGLVWRLLTHHKSDSFKKTASVASFCTHLLTVMAAIPFTIMAGNALS